MKGKHSAQVRRSYEADVDEATRQLRVRLQAERDAHAVTRRRADRAAGLEQRCAELTAQIAANTSDELRDALARNEELLDHNLALAMDVEHKREVLEKLYGRLNPHKTLEGWEAVLDILDPAHEATIQMHVVGVRDPEKVRRIQRARGIRRS